MLASHLILALGWVLYFIIHSLLAHTRFKLWASKKMGRSYKYYRFIYSLVALLLLIPLLYWQITTESILLWNPVLLTLVSAYFFIIIGTIGVLVCLKKYLLPKQGFRSLYFDGSNPELQVSGLHRIVRHPLYLSTFVLLGGVFLLYPYVSFLITYLLIIIYVLIAIPLEEEKLIELYGENYLKYRKSVRAIIPWRM